MINDIELSRENSSYVFESIEECNIHFHKIDFRRGSSFIEQPAWLKNKKATINPQNNDIYCFMYAVTIALYSKELETKNTGRISKKGRMYADTFLWCDVNFPATYDDYKKFERPNDHVALNISYVPYEEENILPEYIRKRNFDDIDQIILLKISDAEGK